MTHLNSPFWMGTCFQFLLFQIILYWTVSCLCLCIFIGSLSAGWISSRGPRGLCIFTFNRHCQIILQKGRILLPSYHQLTEVPISPSPSVRQLSALGQTHRWKTISHFYLYFFLIFNEVGQLSGMCFPSVFLFLWTACSCALYTFFVGVFFLCFISTAF